MALNVALELMPPTPGCPGNFDPQVQILAIGTDEKNFRIAQLEYIPEGGLGSGIRRGRESGDRHISIPGVMGLEGSPNSPHAAIGWPEGFPPLHQAMGFIQN